MKAKLDRAWTCYKRYLKQNKRVRDRRSRFSNHVRKVLNSKNVLIEWQQDGSCIVAGVILFTLDS